MEKTAVIEVEQTRTSLEGEVLAETTEVHVVVSIGVVEVEVMESQAAMVIKEVEEVTKVANNTPLVRIHTDKTNKYHLQHQQKLRRNHQDLKLIIGLHKWT